MIIQNLWKRIYNNKMAFSALLTLGIIIGLAVFAPVLSPYKANEIPRNQVTGFHIFGVDQYGRDLWVRTWTGTRMTLLIASFAVLAHVVIGGMYGMACIRMQGRIGKWMAGIPKFFSRIPNLVFVFFLANVFPVGIGWMIAALSIAGWLDMARQVQERMVISTQSYIRFPFDYVLFDLASVIFTESFLSFVGMGVTEEEMSLGVLLNTGYSVLKEAPQALLVPAFVMIFLMSSLIVLGEFMATVLKDISRTIE